MSVAGRPNRLANETSPYLLQHARNPVDWYPWGPEALAKARRENKPIFLSIGYSACHWCHVMERESFEDEHIARLLNEKFVSIKVDREERPDLDEIYMAATQVFSGSGGWPMSLFLTPDLKPFFAGTYFPPRDLYGRPGFATLLRALADAWENRRADVEHQAEQLAAAVRQITVGRGGRGRLRQDLVTDALDAYRGDFDPVYGGFGGAPKFPPSMRLELILREYRRRPLPEVGRMAEVTLERMARGGIYDQIGGGFARYSVDERWLAPHFEKMLYDNALLTPLYVDAFRLFHRPYFRHIATQTLDFWLREMTYPHGGFYSSLDADSEGEEGKFYLWTPEPVIDVLGKEEGEFFCRVFDITPRGNFEGKSIPNLVATSCEDIARLEGVSGDALLARIDPLRQKLWEARSKRVHPGLDDKILTAWNGLMIRACAHAGGALGERRYVDAAVQGAEFVLTHLRQGGRLLVSWRNGVAKLSAYLDDYAFLAVGLLELHAATGDGRWLAEARALVDTLNQYFWDEDEGGYFFTASDHEALIARVKSPQDNALPSGNAMAARALIRLAEWTGEADYRRRAEQILTANVENMVRFPTGFGAMLVATDRFLETGPPSATSADRVRVTAEASPAVVRPGESTRLQVRFEIEPGWHISASAPGGEHLIPTTVSVGEGLGITAGEAAFPEPLPKAFGMGFAGETLPVYEGTVTAAVALRVSPETAPNRYGIPVRVRYQACSQTECLSPVEEQRTVELEVRA